MIATASTHHTPRFDARWLMEVITLAALYFLTARLGLLMAMPGGHVTPVWPPSGIALAALLLRGRRVWPGIWLGSFAANILDFYGSPLSLAVELGTSTTYGIGASLTALLGSSLLRRVVGERNPLERVRDVCAFMALGGVASCLVSATIGVTSLCLAGFAQWSGYGQAWLTWWLGDTAGVFIVAPLLLVWGGARRRKAAARWLELFGGFGLLIAVTYYVFIENITVLFTGKPLTFILIPFLVWSAVRFGRRGAATAVGLIALLAVWGTINGSGPFNFGSRNESLLALELFLSVVSLTALCIAAVVMERRRVLDELESRVAERTASLDQANAALRESEARFVAFMDHLPGFAWMKDLEGRYTYVNAMLAQLRPYRATWLGKTDADLCPSEPAAIYRANDEAVIATGKPLQTVESYLKDGEVSYLLVSKFPILDATGAVEQVGGASMDITARKKAEEALAEQAMRYKTLMETSADSIYVLDERGDLQEANAAFLTRRGYTAAEAKSLNVADWDTRWTREQLLEGLRTWVDGGSVFETQHRCKDGSVFDVEACVTRVRIGGQSLFFGVARDITERKQAERALQESDERFRQITENINGIFWVWTVEPGQKHCLYVSPAYATIWGRSCESLYAAPGSWREALHPNDKEWVLAEFTDPDVAKPIDLTYRIVRSDQSIRWIRDRIFPVRDARGVVIRSTGIAEDITESKTIEKALESAEQQYRSIFNNAVDGIFRTSPDGKFLVANPAAAHIFGFDSPQELIEERRDIAQQGYVDPRRREEFKRLLQEEGVVNGFEYEAYRKDGGRVWISENTRAVHSPSGEILYFEGIFEDVTDRKRAEEALNAQALRYKTLMETSTDSIYVLDENGDLQEANAAFLDRRGYTAAEVKSLSVADWDARWTREQLQTRLRKLAESGAVFEARHRCKDGSIFDVEVGATSVRIGGEQLFFCVTRDITERKQAEDRLQRSEEKFKTLFGIAPVGISVLDRQHNIVDANPALEQITRLSREELLNGTYRRRSYLNADGTPKPPHELASERALAENQHINDVETGIVTENGEIIWTQVSVARLALPDASAVVITQDITERKRAAKELEGANDQLRFLSRRLFQVQEDEKRHLARELHDEMGQALTAVKINLQSARSLEDPADLARRLDESICIVAGLLHQTRRLSLDLRPPLLDDLGLVPALRSYLHEQAQRAGFRATFFADPRLERLSTEIETACFRVAQQALTNAAQHAQARTVIVELHLAPQALHLMVRDDGAGFDVDVAEERARGGGSLGLPGMRERLSLVGGELDCKSTPGRGTEVHAFLPLEIDSNGSGLLS